jgi:uncharacterized glyoxalase superfamily protein PhnB
MDGIEAFYDQCIANGATIVKPLTDTAWERKTSTLKTRMVHHRVWWSPGQRS